MPKRIDANHSAFREGLKALGAVVGDVHEVGSGFPDLVAFWEYSGITIWLEVKAGPEASFTKKETDWWREAEARGLDPRGKGCWLFRDALQMLCVPFGSVFYCNAMGAYTEKMRADRVAVPEQDREAYAEALRALYESHSS